MQNIKIVSEATNENPFFVFYKSAGLPSAPIKKNDECAISLAVNQFPFLKNVCGKKENEFGLLHRLDTKAEGLLLVASTQESYDALFDFQKNNVIKKTYSCLCNIDKENAKKLDAFPICDFENIRDGSVILVSSFFRSFGKNQKVVRPVNENANFFAQKKMTKAKYETKIFFEKLQENYARVQCTITNGFRHQVRCHLAWLGFPVVGDENYNANFSGERLHFVCTVLSFPHPLTKKIVNIKVESFF